ncbi:hypothetical protein KDA_74800 [Dictyobacter alpinus]|uniref:Adaptor protein ClpS core domain-containing protein n=1 Tax=Dictyobacter alpinus TaxID=2014873 RepID=A0A402BKZ5_9CHLR|nr:ATP-dependent Clp protease adaptor ClpS [Dictyobacter alpinus]GCE31996.1 hypothetical protein KDA_74800 [Dictyobacter alpinus]
MSNCLPPSLSTQLETAQREALPQTHVEPLRPHAVILHRDEYHYDRLDYVAEALMTVVGVLSLERARGIAEAAFTIGQAVVIVCPMETAEHYQECLSTYGLTVTVEAK